MDSDAWTNGGVGSAAEPGTVKAGRRPRVGMSRSPRFLPKNKDGVLVEVSSRTVNAWALLRPSAELSDVTVGVLGRSLEISPVEIVAVSFLSNHWHGLLVVEDQQRLSRFMQHFQGNLAREVGRIVGWKGPLWSRRYDGIVVSDEPKVQWKRLRYVLENSVKEGLCESPLEWPGVHAARALVDGVPLEGHWFDRTREWMAERRNEKFETYDFATKYLVGFSPLPAFRELTPEAYREKVTALVREIEDEGARDRGDRPVLGVEKILSQDRFKAPSKAASKAPKKSPRPRFHTKSPAARAALWGEFNAFTADYGEAAKALLSGRLDAVSWFPEGSYLPAMIFAGDPAPPTPPPPPTREVTKSESGIVERGEIPVVEIPGRMQAAAPPKSQVRDEPRARGQPP